MDRESMVLRKISVSLADSSLQQNTELLRELKARPKAALKEAPIPTVFDTILNPDPSKRQFTPPERALAGDAFLFFGAGTDTTANILAWGTYEILRKPQIADKLRAELRQAIPNKDDIASWATLEPLPYLVSFSSTRIWRPLANCCDHSVLYQ